MNSILPLPSDIYQANQSAFRDRARLFYAGAAALLLAVMFLGFQQFYLRRRSDNLIHAL